MPLGQRLRGLKGRLFLLWLIVGLLSPPIGLAEPVEGLYTTDVLVSSQGRAERVRAAGEGLAEVLLRVSGHPPALRHPEVRQALKRAQRYVSEFSYESTEETLETGGAIKPAHKLILKYSASQVEQLLRKAQQPIWPSNRPNLLVWLVIDEFPSGRRLVGDAPVQDSLRAAALRRGLPMIYPLLDLQDQIALSADALWDMDEASVLAASRRYHADGILVGRYSQTSRGQWLANWKLLHKDEAVIFDSASEEFERMLNGGLDQVADYLAGLYAIVPGEQGPDAVVVQLSGVDDFASYAAALNYLDGLAMVRHAALVAVRGDTLLLNLFTEGDLSQLLDTLALDNKLIPANEGGSLSLPGSRYSTKGSAENPLQFRWPR